VNWQYAPRSGPRRPREVKAVPTNAQLKIGRALDLFNASEHPRTVAGLARTLGPPQAGAVTSDSSAAEVVLTIAWELSWYQFCVDLSDGREPVRLRVENGDTLFTNRYEVGQVLTMPVAHGDGRYTADETTLDRLEGEGQVVLRYVPSGGETDRYWSPNGSMRAIAGIVNASGNVLGLMPHPERAMDTLLGSSDGIGMFESMLARVAA